LTHADLEGQRANSANSLGGGSPRLVMRGISKRFGETQALTSVDLTVHAGTVHGLVGENGAGKSTLLKVLGGLVVPDSGNVQLDGDTVDLRSPARSREVGIQVVHQELALLPELSVAENLFAGAVPSRLGFVRKRAMVEAAHQAFERLGTQIPADRRVSTLSTAQQQLVEVARGLLRSSKVLILDEPTAALPPADAERLLEVLRDLTTTGMAVILVSHRLGEILEVAQTVSVLKDGANVATVPAAELDGPTLIRLMVGRELSELYPPRVPLPAGEPVLRLNRLVAPPYVRDVSLDLHRGEGLDGAGQAQVLSALAGVVRPSAGVLELDGEPIALGRVRHALRRKIGFVPPDRKTEGLFLESSSILNISLPIVRSEFSHLGLLDQRREVERCTEVARYASVRGDLAQPARTLSGGNQQKVLLARLLAAHTNVLLLDQPTRGVDIGAKAEIYQVIRATCREGSAALIVSPEILELLGLCDRIVVMREGTIAGEVDAATSSEAEVLGMAVPL
jgi:ribose transport system ATP-binding protein